MRTTALEKSIDFTHIWVVDPSILIKWTSPLSIFNLMGVWFTYIFLFCFE